MKEIYCAIRNKEQYCFRKTCPDILEQEGKVESERIHSGSPARFNPQRTTPRNIIAKFKNYQTKEKILRAAKKKSFRYQGNEELIQISRNYSQNNTGPAASTWKDRKAWNSIF